MNYWNWQLVMGLSLLALSAVVYYFQILIFDNAHDTIFYLLQDLAFVPMQILLVTLLVNQLLSMREKRALIRKMNMVIGVFFSEVGTELVQSCCDFDHNAHNLKKGLNLDFDWIQKDFRHARRMASQHHYKIDSQKGDLAKMREYLLHKRQFLLGLLANPNLLEHDSFTEMLWAVFHLAEELAHRDHVVDLPHSDYAHIAGDIERVYSLLIYEWLAYMSHLQTDYSYLFSLAVRTNPFANDASPVVR